MINVPQRFAGCIFMPENNANVCEISKKQKHQKTEVSTKESIDKRKHQKMETSKNGEEHEKK